MTQKIAFSCLSFLLCLGTFAQQDPLFSTYQFDKVLVNPAFAGSSSWAVGTAKHRVQHFGTIKNASTETFNFHGPIQKKHLGLGFKLVFDKAGLIKTTDFATDVSYHLNFAGGKLSLGLEAGFRNCSVDYSTIKLDQINDASIPLVRTAGNIGTFASGFYYQLHQFYIGFSRYAGFGQSILLPRWEPCTFIMMGNVFSFPHKYSMEVLGAMRTQFGLKQADLNVTAYYSDKFGIGLQLRSNGTAAAVLRLQIMESFRLAYSHDFILSGRTAFNFRANEFVLSYGIKLPPPPSKKEVHPRYYY